MRNKVSTAIAAASILAASLAAAPSASAATPAPTGYRDYLNFQSGPEQSITATGADQCSLPVAQRTGAWMCLNGPATTPSESTTQGEASAAAAGPCVIPGARWLRNGTAASQADGCGPYGYGKNVLGTATFHVSYSINGSTITSKPAWMESTRAVKDAVIEGDRLYISATYPQGNAVKPSKYGITKPVSRAANRQVLWTPNGYKSTETTVQKTSQVNNFVWHDAQYPGRWYVYFKSIIADRKAGGGYAFRADEQVPRDGSVGGYDPAP